MKTNLLRTAILCSFLTFGLMSANAQVNQMYKKDTTGKHLGKDTSHTMPGMYKDTVRMKNDTPPKQPGSVAPPHQMDVLFQDQMTAKKEE